MTRADLLIIGAGPGGYETAIEAAQAGLTTVLVEAREVGGTCLNEGCIPTKCLCRDAERLSEVSHLSDLGLPPMEASPDFARIAARKDSVVAALRSGVETMLKHPNLTLMRGTARFAAAHTVEVALNEKNESDETTETIEATNVIIATGSVTKFLPIEGAHLPGVLTSTDLLALDHVPLRLCIVGGGVIGMEFASVFSAFGSQVTVLEFCREILPNFDSDVAKRLRTALKQRGIDIVTQARVERISPSGEGELTVGYTLKEREKAVTADRVLMAVGRGPNLTSLNLDDVGIAYTKRGIETDESLQTNVEGVYAIGDINGRCQLAHAATFQGRRALNHILGRTDGIRLDIMPAAVFTAPEAASVGLTLEEAQAQGIEAAVGKAFFRANGKALAMGQSEGLVKLVATSDGRLLGCHILGPHAADLVQEVAALMRLNGTVKDLSETVHAHPTLGEVVLEAARRLG